MERKLPRMKDFNYSQYGCYFITICTFNRQNIFGIIKDGKLILNEFGKIANDMLLDLPHHHPGIELDKYVIMPNHMHILLSILKRIKPMPTVSEIIGLYKSGVTRIIHKLDYQIKVWQTSYHDHIIRNERDYNEIIEYIVNNPINWEQDKFNSK